MPSIILTTIVAGLGYLIFTNLYGLQKNVSAARRSGLKYKIVPVYFLTTWWLAGHRLLLPLFRKLPKAWTRWVDFVLPEFSYHYRYEVFQRIGADTFLAASPGGITMYTCDPAVISQITTKRLNFPKPTHIYSSLDLYGKNVVSTERNAWRVHRKATSPPFTEKNNHLVWYESVRQAEKMLASWVGKDGKGDVTVDRVMDDTMRLSLNVISAAGFGRTMEWPNEETQIVDGDDGYADDSKIKNEGADIDPGHNLSYTYALHCLLENVVFHLLLSRDLLKKLPFTKAKKAYQSYVEWGMYMRELLLGKKAALESGSDSNLTNDILTLLVKDQLMPGEDGKPKGTLTETEVLGNMFVMILAGHETAANSLHFAAIYLALFPETQRRLQKDLDSIFQGRPSSEWNYDRDLPALFGGMAGAVLAEELRLVPPVTNIPKSTMEGVGPQKLVVNGEDIIVPANTYINLCTGPAHRHPKHWPTSPPTFPGGHPVHPLSNLENDLEEFHPERWLVSEEEPTKKTADGIPVETLAKEDGLGVNESSDTSDRLFKPVKGSYLPFSEGYRACLGRRFAQVEILAVLAVIYQNYSVELAVDKFTSDDKLDNMDNSEKAEVWQKSAEYARWLMLEGLGTIFTLQIRKGTVPLRFVPRGKERFPDNIDAIWKQAHPDKCSNRGNPGWSCWRK